MAQTLSPPRPPLQDPEPEPIADAEPRRPVAAGRSFVALLVCLGLWGLLFAPVLERDAETGPLGARRTAALAVLRPLTALSDALALGRASEAAMAALGRNPNARPGGELDLPEFDLPPLPRLDQEPIPVEGPPADRVSPSVTVPTGPAPEEPAEEEPAQETVGGPAVGEPAVGIRTPTARAKLRVAVVGDSLSQGLGPAVVQLFDPEMSRVLTLGRQSTGLARQDYFNWRGAMRTIEQEFRPDLVFVLLGSNDNQAQITSDGSEVPVGSTAWIQAYRQRATAFLREATSNGTHVVWVGIPVVRDQQRWTFYQRVNGIYADVAEADPFATYLDGWKLLSNRRGQYAAYLENERGVLQAMRAGDGFHLTPTGYAFLARHAVRAAAEAFDLPQAAVLIRV
ncbi:MAG TPA: DUF459 domain-containing protein [Actinomycetota bacterium]|nr:DUF459 domain-containing protein [Actinomycetota bacterium]